MKKYKNINYKQTTTFSNNYVHENFSGAVRVKYRSNDLQLSVPEVYYWLIDNLKKNLSYEEI